MAPRDYQAVLIKLLSYLDAVDYDKDHVFTAERLAAITPADLMRYLNHRCFGNETPPLDANPVGCRSSSISFWKKAISYFMPNRLLVYNELSNQGNPTRSREVNDLIKRVKKKEVRRQGVASSARRPMEDLEFRHLVQLLRADTSASIIRRYGIPSLIAFQFSMIARVDDATQFLVDNLRAHDRFPN